MFSNVNWLDQFCFYVFIEASGEDLAESVEFAVFYMEFVSNLASVFDGFACIEVFTCVFLDSASHGESWPRAFDIDFGAFIGEFGCAVGCECAGFDDFFCLFNDVFDVAVCLVCFDGCEFRVVTGIHAFVSEVSGDFENSFIAAHEESLQVEFRCNAKVHGHVECIEMSGEWLCVCAAIEWLENRGFDFEESVVGVPFADSCHHGCSLDECGADFRIDHEVEVSLAITLFLVSQAVPFFRQRTEGFGQHGEVVYADGEFTGMCGEYDAFDAKDIAHVDELPEVPFLFGEDVFSEV